MKMKRFIILLFWLVCVSTQASTNDSLRVLSLKNNIQEQLEQETVSIAPLLNELLEIYQNRYSIQSNQYADCLMWCSSICADAGDNEQAKHLLERSNSLFKQYGTGVFNGKDTINEIFFLDTKSKIEYNSGRDFMAVQLSKNQAN